MKHIAFFVLSFLSFAYDTLCSKSDITYVNTTLFHEIQKATQISFLRLDKIIRSLKNLDHHHDLREQQENAVIADHITTHHGKVGCIIGMDFGRQAFDILKKTEINQLYCVGPLVPTKYATRLQHLTEDHWKVLAHITRKKLSRFKKRFMFVESFPRIVATQLKPASLDFLCINMAYACEDLRTVLHTWFGKIKQNGFIFLTQDAQESNSKASMNTHLFNQFAKQYQCKVTTQNGVHILQQPWKRS